MQDHRIRLRLLSPVGTPWQSDTIFGHLAWHVAYGRAGMTIEDFLRPFRQGRPPFVLSDAFPDGYLPRPLLPVLPAPKQPGETANERPSTAQEYAQAKRKQKAQFVSESDFQALRRGQVSDWEPPDNPWRDFQVLHASINRLTGTTTGPETEPAEEAGPPEALEGHLFSTRLSAPAAGDGVLPLSVFLRADAPWDAKVPEMLCELSKVGFGRDKSTGVGAFEVLDVQPYDGFAPLPEANAFVSLSSYCPARNDPTRGRWKIRIKYGKLGENAGAGNPFKRPLIQFEPGAVFLTDGPPRPIYGRAVEGIAPAMPEAIQCCFTLAVPCVIPQDLLESFSQ
ncbi:MAG: hypothetical protein N2512_06555 [Armatimonadetes bacterium]|nr:hypothetical protein [Armatimonadota bacterium]